MLCRDTTSSHDVRLNQDSRAEKKESSAGMKWTDSTKDVVDIQEALQTLSIGKTPTLRMRSVSPSPPNHLSLSPGPERRRANTYSAGQLIRPQVFRRALGTSSPPCSPRRRITTARDAVQPSSGSFSDLSSERHSSASAEGDDEDEGPAQRDLFPGTAERSFRPRARTCPENRAWRKKKLRVLNRPPTPPPNLGSLTLGKPSGLEFHSPSPCRSPLGGSVDRLSARSSSRELASFEEEDFS